MWAGVEPEPGQFNKTYVNILKEIVEKYKSDQMYFILDMHQDVLWETPGLVTLFHLFVDIILAIQFNFSYFSIHRKLSVLSLAVLGCAILDQGKIGFTTSRT